MSAHWFRGAVLGHCSRFSGFHAAITDGADNLVRYVSDAM